MRRPSALASRPELVRALAFGARALERALRDAVNDVDELRVIERPGLPHPAAIATFTTSRRALASLRVAIDEAYRRHLMEGGGETGTHGSVLSLEPPSLPEVSDAPGTGGRARLLATASAWPDRRSWRVDVALHERAQEQAPDALAARLGLRARGAWTPSGIASLRAIERRVEACLERLGFSPLRAPVREALSFWASARRGRHELPARFHAPTIAGESEALALVRLEEAAGEIDRSLGAIEAELATQGLDLAREHAPDGSGSRLLATNRWGLHEHELASARLERETEAFASTRDGSPTPLAVIRLKMARSEALLDRWLEELGPDLPAWLAPVQVKLVPLLETANPSAFELLESARANGWRATIDIRREEAASKLRQAEDERVPVFLVLGPRDVERGTVAVHLRDVRGEPETLAQGMALQAISRHFGPDTLAPTMGPGRRSR